MIGGLFSGLILVMLEVIIGEGNRKICESGDAVMELKISTDEVHILKIWLCHFMLRDGCGCFEGLGRKLFYELK